jgi:hypothetical protein
MVHVVSRILSSNPSTALPPKKTIKKILQVEIKDIN